MTATQVIEPLVQAVLGESVPVHLRCWDGSEFGRAAAPVQLTVRRRALRWLPSAPSELGLARAYVSGDVEVEGDPLAGLDALERVALPAGGPGVLAHAATKKAVVMAAFKLGMIGPPRSRRARKRGWPAPGTAERVTPRRSRITTNSATTSTAWCSASR